MMRERFAKAWVDLVQKARGWDYRPALADLERNQWLPRAEIEKRNINRLRKLLLHCKEHVPFYREQMNVVGFDANQISSLTDLSSLPIISKVDLREDYSKFKAEGSNSEYDSWPSSGSTGEPFLFRLDRRSIQANTFAALARGKRWWGMDFGVREGMIWSGFSDLSGTPSGRFAAIKRRISWGLKNVTTVDVYLLDDKAIALGYAALLRSRPRVLRTIASGLLRFCNGIEKLGLDGKKLGIEVAIFTGEGLSQAQRDRIESILGCPTAAEYGCTELGIIAFECPEGGLHISHDNLIIEFIVNGRPAEPGEQGELVITNLNEWIHPLVRYKVGDFAAPSSKVCVCGRTLPLISELGGRVHDSIHTPLGRVIHGLFFNHLFDQLPEVAQFRVIQRKLDSLDIEIVVPGASAKRAQHSVAKAVREKLAEDMSIVVHVVDSLPAASSGKTRWIVSELDIQKGNQ